MNKLQVAAVAIISASTVGIIFAVAMEIATGEPVYMVVMKIAAGLLAIGGPLLGWGIARRARRH